MATIKQLLYAREGEKKGKELVYKLYNPKRLRKKKPSQRRAVSSPG